MANIFCKMHKRWRFRNMYNMGPRYEKEHGRVEASGGATHIVRSKHDEELVAVAGPLERQALSDVVQVRRGVLQALREEEEVVHTQFFWSKECLKLC